MTSSTPKSEVIFAPKPYLKDASRTTIFLSGSIDASPPSWRDTFSSSISHLPVRILDPSRPDWDSSWRESMDFTPWVEQVNWELNGIENADIVVVYFGAEAKAPISLLELGLAAKTKSCVVCVKDGYWKGANVRLVCKRLGIQVVEKVEDLAASVESMVKEGESAKGQSKEKLEAKFEGVSKSDMSEI